VSPRARMGCDGMPCNGIEKQDELCVVGGGVVCLLRTYAGGVVCAVAEDRAVARARANRHMVVVRREPQAGVVQRKCAQVWALPVACVCVLGGRHNGCACGDSRKAMCACAVAELLCACVGVGLVAVKLGWVVANS